MKLIKYDKPKTSFDHISKYCRTQKKKKKKGLNSVKQIASNTKTVSEFHFIYILPAAYSTTRRMHEHKS